MRLDGLGCYGRPVKKNLPGCRAKQSQKTTDQGGLPNPIDPEESKDLSFLDIKIYIIQDTRFPKFLSNILKRNKSIHYFLKSSKSPSPLWGGGYTDFRKSNGTLW